LARKNDFDAGRLLYKIGRDALLAGFRIAHLHGFQARWFAGNNPMPASRV